jgi:DnaK suppressor protein
MATKKPATKKPTTSRVRSSSRSTATKSAPKRSTKQSASDPLAQRAAEAQQVIDSIERTSFAGDEREVSDELAAVDQHPSEHADVTLQRELDYTIREIVDDDLAQIREAMQRKQEGTYGTCSDCRQKIPKARLEARPEATRCIECQRRFEGERA